MHLITVPLENLLKSEDSILMQIIKTVHVWLSSVRSYSVSTRSLINVSFISTQTCLLRCVLSQKTYVYFDKANTIHICFIVFVLFLFLCFRLMMLIALTWNHIHRLPTMHYKSYLWFLLLSLLNKLLIWNV